MKRAKTTPTSEADLGSESYFQIQDEAVPYLDALIVANPNAFRVLLWLLQHTNKKNEVIADQARIGRELALHRNTISKVISYLREQQLLQTYKAGSTNGYRLNAYVCWRDIRPNRYKAPFIHSLQPQPAQETTAGIGRGKVLPPSSASARHSKGELPADFIHAVRKQEAEMKQARAAAPPQKRKIAKGEATYGHFEPPSPTEKELRKKEVWEYL